jgi:plasmid stabilization system protein ParE
VWRARVEALERRVREAGDSLARDSVSRAAEAAKRAADSLARLSDTVRVRTP